MRRKEGTLVSVGAFLLVSVLACGAPAPALPTVQAPTQRGRTTPSASTALGELATPTSTSIIEEGNPAPTRSAPIPADESHFRDGQDVELTEIRMVSRSEGWGVAGAYVLKTQDGGQTWREVTPPLAGISSDTNKAFGAFLDSLNAWVVFAGSDKIPSSTLIWNTTDGGSTWQAIEVAQEAFGEVMWAEFFALDPARVWVVFRGVYLGAGTHYTASFLSTPDGGASWEPLPSNIGNDYTGIAFADSGDGWLIWETTGAYAAAPPELGATRDGGLTWDVVDLPPPEGAPTLFEDYEYSEPYALNILSAMSLRLLVGSFGYGDPPTDFAGYLYTTEDGGSTWDTHALPEGVLAPDYEMVFFDTDNGILLGRTMYRTADGGQTWERIKNVAWDGDFSFVDSQYGWAVARSGEAIALVSTVNGGSTWVELHPVAKH